MSKTKWIVVITVLLALTIGYILLINNDFFFPNRVRTIVRFDDVAMVTKVTTGTESGYHQRPLITYTLQYSSDGFKTGYQLFDFTEFGVGDRVEWVKKIDPISNTEYAWLEKVE